VDIVDICELGRSAAMRLARRTRKVLDFVPDFVPQWFSRSLDLDLFRSKMPSSNLSA
jgi:hypothetical protein